MLAAKPGEIWMVDLGMAAKVRPCLVLTPTPKSDDELDVFTVVAHTKSLRGSRWELGFQKSFLSREGAFDVQRVATVASVNLAVKKCAVGGEEDAPGISEKPGRWDQK